ncbi:hypothetical protein O1611_g4625 [Lasiodiplodia mahajangana]|uniref:Uncharacterized protein n=1 Tax=Lasiodiplodia mahajangana TaxID=1108764 RepID=A0ACC2JP86_9PEZI|nr:hypothetical protein O1611_g4625 [Lasiodiplodia mahajangana]
MMAPSLAKVTDADFMESVLEPHGIKIQTGGSNKNLRKHFGILSLPTNLKERLDVYKKALQAPLNVWLEADMERSQRIEQEYKSLKVYGCNEAEYTTYALHYVFLDEPRHPWLPIEKGDQCWMPVRLLQFVRKPDKLQKGNWEAPPTLHQSSKRFEWDIRPDCTYYISLQAFPPRVRSSIDPFISVIQRRAFGPYFTITFEKDEDDSPTARYKAAVASAIALYNRYRLKSYALQKSGRKWDEEQKGEMRHYSITFAEVRWIVWCTVPKSFETWTGCNMSKLYSGDCDILECVQKLLGIVNDIHYWGLEVNGKSCKADIAVIAQSDPDADLNYIALLE